MKSVPWRGRFLLGTTGKLTGHFAREKCMRYELITDEPCGFVSIRYPSHFGAMLCILTLIFIPFALIICPYFALFVFDRTLSDLLTRFIPYSKYYPKTEYSRPWPIRLLFSIINSFAEYWHGYEIHDLNFSSGGDDLFLLVGYHSRSCADIVYLTSKLQSNLIVTNMLFKIPFIQSLLGFLGLRPAQSENRATSSDAMFLRLLTDEEIPLVLLPGGAFEFTKSTEDLYKVLWSSNRSPGFIRAIASDPTCRRRIKIVPFYTKNCENIFLTTAKWRDYSGKKLREMFKASKTNYSPLLSPALYLLMLFAPGCIMVPVPCKLDTYCGPPLVMGKQESNADFAERVATSLQSLVDAVEMKPQRGFKSNRNFCKLMIIGCAVFWQNAAFHVVNLMIVTILYSLFLVSSYLQSASYPKVRL
jgi:hypothetical protein